MSKCTFVKIRSTLTTWTITPKLIAIHIPIQSMHLRQANNLRQNSPGINQQQIEYVQRFFFFLFLSLFFPFLFFSFFFMQCCKTEIKRHPHSNVYCWLHPLILPIFHSIYPVFKLTHYTSQRISVLPHSHVSLFTHVHLNSFKGL